MDNSGTQTIAGNRHQERTTDHRNLNLTQLNRDVVRGTSAGKIIWQPRIGCWYKDRLYRHEEFPAPYTGKDLPAIYRELGCSSRDYSYNYCFINIDDPRVKVCSQKLNVLETEQIIETPVGRLNAIHRRNASNPGSYSVKFIVSSEEDLKIMTWIEERRTWKWDGERYLKELAIWGDQGLPSMHMPNVTVQGLFNIMGVEGGTYAIYDYPSTVGKYFQALSESHERLIEVINTCPLEVINFGDNVHGRTCPPEMFKKYVMPIYQKRNEILHKAGKFTHAHWDGDVKPLLPYVKECGLDGVEAVTPLPQGDVTLEEVKEAFGDDIFLIDGIDAILFEEDWPLEELEKQARKIIELFAPRLVLGISDEISSKGNLDRIKFVGEIVDDYNAKCINSTSVCRT